MATFAELVAVGRVVKPQGRHGEVAVLPLSDRPDRLPTLLRAFLPGDGGQAREVAIERVWPHKQGFVIKIAGVDSIDAAEALRGLELRIAEDQLHQLPQGSFYHHQLAGLRVVDTTGTPLGEVAEVVETGAAAAVLVVRGPSCEELLIPFAAEFVRSVDVDDGRLVVERPEYTVAD